MPREIGRRIRTWYFREERLEGADFEANPDGALTFDPWINAATADRTRRASLRTKKRPLYSWDRRRRVFTRHGAYVATVIEDCHRRMRTVTLSIRIGVSEKSAVASGRGLAFRLDVDEIPYEASEVGV